MRVLREVDMGLRDQISGPPEGWRSAVKIVAILFAMTEGQIGRPLRCLRKARDNGQC